MIFNWRSVLIVSFLVAFVMWILKDNPEYNQLFKNPKKTWIETDWWKVVLVSISILILSLKFFPMLENFINTHIGRVITDVGGTSQGQIIQKTSEQIGIRPTLVLSGVFFGAVAGAEEVIFRGIILHHLKKRWNWILGLVVSSLLFGLMHLSEAGMTLSMFVYASIAGLIFGSAYLKLGLMSSVILHSGYNLGLALLVALNLMG